MLCHAGFLHWFVARSVATWQCPLILAGCCLDKWQGRWGPGGGEGLCSFLFIYLLFSYLLLIFFWVVFWHFFSHLLRPAFLFIYLLFSDLLLIFFFGLVLCRFLLPSKSFLLLHFIFNFLIFYLCLWVLLGPFFFPSAFLLICLLLFLSFTDLFVIFLALFPSASWGLEF